MTFEYLQDVKFMDSIDIEDIGNVQLEALNDLGDQWYLDIHTSLGYTKIVTIGPLMADSNNTGFSFNFNYQYMEYNDKKLVVIIDKFINDVKKNISQLFFTSHDAIQTRLAALDELNISYK